MSTKNRTFKLIYQMILSRYISGQTLTSCPEAGASLKLMPDLSQTVLVAKSVDPCRDLHEIESRKGTIKIIVNVFAKLTIISHSCLQPWLV